jgi:hypothetical protein
VDKGGDPFADMAEEETPVQNPVSSEQGDPFADMAGSEGERPARPLDPELQMMAGTPPEQVEWDTEPFIDPVDAAAGGFVGGLKSAGVKLFSRQALRKGLTGTGAALASEPVAGGAMEKVDEATEGLPAPVRTPLTVATGMATGSVGEALTSKGGRSLVDAGKALANRPTEAGDTLQSAFVRKFQDRFKRLKDTQTDLAGEYEGGKIPEHSDAYLAEELYHGKARWDLDKFEDEKVKPLVKAMEDSKVSPDELSLYLYARHAPERNARIQKINPKFRDKGIPGSGMDDAEAAEILQGFKAAGKDQDLEALSQKVWDINRERLDVLKKAGMLDDETYGKLLNQYKNYVPLKGTGDKSKLGKGGDPGYDVKDKGVQRAFGRKSQAEDPLTHSVAQYEEALIKARKNEVGQAFLNLVEENPNEKLWTINESRSKPKLNKQGEVEYKPAPHESKNTFHVYRDGKRYSIDIKDDLLASAMKNMGSEKAGSLTKGLAAVNRYLAAINTSYNPEFVISNFSRDIQTAGINLAGEQSTRLAKDVVKDVPKAMRGAYRGYRGKTGGGDWDDWYKEYRESGGAIGFFGLKDVDSRAKDIRKTLDEAKGGATAKARKAGRKSAKLIEDVNAAVENATRLSAYKNAREHGLSKAQAASLAKNLTVNFNRKGELGSVANALYLFYNAGMQGSARVVQALKSPRTRKLGAGIASAAFGLTEMNRRIAGEDEDGKNYYDKIPDWTKERNIVVMKPGTEGDFIKIPLPYGYNVFHVLGEQANTAAHKGEPVKGAANTVRAMINAFNPLGEENPLRLVSPTVTDPMVSLATNKDFAGRPIKPEQPPYQPDKPESELHWDSVNPATKALTQAANKATGGNEHRSGLVDVSPEVVDYLVGQVTGSAGQFVTRTANYGVQKAKGEEVPTWKTPFLRKVAGEQYDYQAVSDYYDAGEEIERIRNEKEAGVLDESRKGYLKLYPRWRQAERKINMLNKRLDRAEKDETIEKLEQEKTKVMKEFLRQYYEQEEGAAAGESQEQAQQGDPFADLGQ